MTRNGPLTQHDVETEIMRRIDLLDEAVDDYDDLAKDAAEKASNYKAEWAKEFMKSGTAAKTVKEREAWTDYKLEALHFEHEVSEALAKAKQARMGALRTQLDALRTLAANVRSMTNG